MSLSVLVAFVGVLVAAAATGLLVGRSINAPRIDVIIWACGTFGLTVALVAQIIGFSRGFSPIPFRAVQLGAQLAAPLWLAWGLVELVATSEPVRFGARLVYASLTIVAGVVLATDPLAAKPFSKAWPAAGTHYQVIPHYALLLVQV